MKKLKLFFALFAMLALGVGNAWAETTISFGYSNWDGVTANFSGTAKDEVTQTVDGIKVTYTRNGSNLYANTSAIRFYKSNTLKFDAPTGYSIQSISFTCTSYKTDITSNVGTCTATSSNLSWSGDATSVTFTRPSSASSYATITGATVTLAATSGGSTPDPGTGEGGEDPETPGTGGSGTIVIKYNSNFTPVLPTTKDGANATSTEHTVENLTIKEQGLYNNGSGYIMFVQGKGFLYNTQSLGTITSVSVTYSSGTSTSGKAGVYFGATEQSTYTTTSNTTIKGTSKTDTWTNTTEGNGFFQLSTSNKNVQITQIEITYTLGSEGGGSGETVPSLTQEQFSWSTDKDEVTMGDATHVYPTLVNTIPVPVEYTSNPTTVATIDKNTGIITLVAPGTTTISAVFEGGEVNGTKYAAKTVDYTLTVQPAPLEPIAGGVIDILDNDWSGLTTSDYATVAAKTAANTGHSNAQYTAQCAGSNSSIQLRSNNNSGIVSTVSGGLVKRVEIEWNDATSAGRTLNIYGSNTPYTNPTDLYDTNKDGDKLGTIVKGTSTYLEISEDYRYIGIRSASGAMYLAKVTITWLPINSTVSIDDAIQHGSVSVTGATDLNAVAAGTVLTLDNTPDTGYKLAAYDVYKTGEESTKVTVTDGKFIMPEFDVTISATFEQLKELDKIEVNTTNVKTTFWQGETFNSTGLVVTAYYTDETSTIVTPKSITGSTAEAGTKQVTVSYTEGEITKETKYDITVKAIANNEETPYTVTVAREIIDAVGETTVDVYVQGIVSKIVTAYNSEYGNISYNISEDGKTTSAQLQAYRGKSYNGDNFTSADDIQVDDKVVVKGKLKKHDTTYEFAQDNQLVSLVRSTEPKPTAATLPFEFDGNKDDIADVVGMSQTGLGTYDSSPKLKFDTENDNVIIHFDSEPGEFSFLLKQNGNSVGTFTVYESENGEDYTSIWSGGDLGGTGKSATIKPTISATSRYVKFEYTTKPSGTNYGLGQISIKKIDKRQEAGLAWSPATVSLTVGDAFTAPTFSNRNTVTGITFTSDNEALATVNNVGVISLVNGKTGIATITATYAGNETYKPAEVMCTISVSPKTENVVILAQHAGNWYALKAQGAVVDGVTKTDRLAALPVEYFNGTLYNVEDADKALITWERVVTGDKATFKNGTNYLVGSTSTTLSLDATEFNWTYNGETYLSDEDTRTFLYHKDGIFRNYGITNASDGIDEEKTYSALPVVTAPVYSTEEFVSVYTRPELPVGNYGTICLPYAVNNFTGATFYEVAGKEGRKVIFDEVTELEAGKPYIFMAEAAEIKLAQVGEEYTGSAKRHNSLQGTFTQIDPTEDNILKGNYMVVNNVIKKCGINCGLKANRAYFVADDLERLGAAPQPMPGRRRVTMGVTGENEATGVDNITENGVIAPAMQGTYDIMGRQLSEPTATGFYIVNGKKVFVVK